LESIRDCKYGCGKKIKYDSVSFSDGFTVSIPWELTAKGDLADIRNYQTEEDTGGEYAPESIILLLGLENFLDLLYLRDYKGWAHENNLKPILTDEERKKAQEPIKKWLCSAGRFHTIQYLDFPEPSDEEWREGIKNTWEFGSYPKKKWIELCQQLNEEDQVADLQTPNAENKSFDKLMPADQQTLLVIYKELHSEHFSPDVELFRSGMDGYWDRIGPKHKFAARKCAGCGKQIPDDFFGNDRKWSEKISQYSESVISKLIPRQRTDEEIKKEIEKIQQDPIDEYEDLVDKEACESIITHQIHECQVARDKHAADSAKHLDMLHKEWDKKHPENRAEEAKEYHDTFFEFETTDPQNKWREASELEKEYYQFRKEDGEKHPEMLTTPVMLRQFEDAGDFEGALSHIKEYIDDHLHRDFWGGGHAIFRDLSILYQKLGKHTDALLAMELQLLVNNWDWDYFQLVDLLLDMDWGFDAISVLNHMQKRISEWDLPFGIWSHEEVQINQLFTDFATAYWKVGNAPKQQEYIEKIIEFEKVLHVVHGQVQGNVEQLLTLDKKIKTREDLAKCLLKQGKFKDASVILGEANKLRDELSDQKILAGKKENLSAEEIKNFQNNNPEFIQAFTDEIIKQQEEKPKTGKGFKDPFPNMSEDDYVGTMEFEFRNLIVNKLMRFTNWEKDRVPQDVWERAVELKKTAEADPILLDYEKRIIDYVDFTDYIKIFRFKKNWEKIFQPVFKDSDLFFGQLKILQKLRNPIAHHRGNKLRNHLSKHGHGELVSIYNYFMFMIQKDKDRNQPLEVG